MNARLLWCSLIAAGVAAVPLVTMAQPAPVDPYGGATYGSAMYGGDAYGDPYGSEMYGGDAYGGASYGADPYGGASYGGSSPLALPAVIATDWTTGLVRLDDHGRRVLLQAPVDGRVLAHTYQPLVVDEATGRWFVTRQSKGRPARAWTVVFGDRTGVTGEVAGDARCGGRGPACFEVPLAFTTDGAGVMTLSMFSTGFTLARYDFARAGRRELAGKAIATRLALAPTQDRAAYVTRGGLTLIGWTAKGAPARPRGQQLKIDGQLDRLVMLDEAVLFRRRVTARDHSVATTLEVIDRATGDREVVYRPRHELAWAPLPAPARGSAFVHDCDNTRSDNPCDIVEVTVAGSRTMVRGVARAYDVSDDGRYLLAIRHPRDRASRATGWPDVVVIDLATGRDARVFTEVPADNAQFTR